MNAVVWRNELQRGLSFARSEQGALAAFTVTMFLSALLLFSVQPIFAKMVLPKLGGSPSVWAVSMCFFQAILLAGYGYAHALNRYAKAQHAPLIHIAVLSIALLALPFGLPQSWSEPPAGDAYFWLIGLLTVGVGLPFFAISANAPLLQAWFSRTGHPHASDPYFLYGASNLGSLIALLSYPILFEPTLGLATQADTWTKGFVLLGLCIVGCGLLMLSGQRDVESGQRVSASTANAARSAPLTWTQRGVWIALAAIPSGLLVAFTSYVSTDIAAAPFLWVIPLAIFLATFILVFRDKPLIPHKWMLIAQPALACAVFAGISTAGANGWALGAIAGFAAFFVTTMVCHTELFNRRPDSSHLTEFYMWMSFGGVIGGFFAAIVAPQLFTSIYEFPLLLLAGIAIRPGVLKKLETAPTEDLLQLARIAAIAIGLMFAIDLAISYGVGIPKKATRSAFIFVPGILALIYATHPRGQATAVAIAFAAIAILPSAMNRGDAERSFFGVHRVAEMGHMRVLMHGTTIHGAERLTDKDGNAMKVPVPSTYYYDGSPMARGVDVARVATGKQAGDLSVGIVGLGAGSMACHSRANERWRFYEIDPVVAKIATDPTRFRFMSHCRPNADIILGDARLTVAKAKTGSFDYLVIDAFSSDSVPVHLLTKESLAMYLGKLSPDGLLALHVSNRHLDIASVAVATANAVPGAKARVADDPVKFAGLDKAGSQVVFVTKSDAVMKQVAALGFREGVVVKGVTPWTDDYSNILAAIWRKKD